MPISKTQTPDTLITQKSTKKPPRNRASGIPRIVGIGASAGGLEALEAFLSHMPADSGLAFVIIQHLDPVHKGVMPELLQRITPMRVTQAGNRMKVKANCVYVIPPNKDLSVLHGSLYLLDPVAARGLRLSIDFFFRSLAEDQHERAIGVILSGMGSDGTLGLRAIKENAGLSLVQDPETAKFDAMPRSVIQAGLADIVAPAQELPTHIINYLNHSHHVADSSIVGSEPILPLKSQNSLEQIIILLRERTSHDFSLYKKNTIYRRIERRMGLHKIDAIASYVRYLRENPHELDLLFKELLIGVTNFFRDPAVWEQLKTVALPALLDNYLMGKPLRAWVPACSTGEEAYSLAMVFNEVLNQRQSQTGFSLQIFATDLDDDAIEKARQGFYRANISEDVSTERLKRFFIQEENGYRISKTIREMVIFAPQNIIMDPPFTKLDIISCRNLMIYLDQQLQNKLIPLFHYALTAHGLLMLGNAETIGSQISLFKPIDKNARLYQRIDNILPMTSSLEFPIKYFPVSVLAEKEPRSTQSMTGQPANLETLTEQFLLRHFTPAAVLVNTDGDIVYISGRTGKYLEPAAGKANWNIYAMAREGLRNELALALKKAQRQPEAVFVPDLTLDMNGIPHSINLTVQALTSPDLLCNKLIVVFNDIAPPLSGKLRRRKPGAIQKLLETQLQQALEDLQTTREEMQSSQEELKSANEELQSSNEELQSTNEELNTSKEEMQSLNEELQTVNAELQSKVEDLTWVNNDMKNLLDSMEIATVFLDNQLKIRRFTSYATHLFKLIPGDLGRQLSDIVTDLDYPQFMADIQKVAQTLAFIDQQIKTFDNRWFKVRIMPYRTQDNVIDGVVITFVDICEIKQLEAELRDKIE
ncbi:chemotaxis protein CheB [Methylomonas lenta]|uniref:Chemotaxis protein CheB n=1 Tax=Methylomonas lenta TaxID=980561 RepID=A0A177MWK4_9GAMM|nr:chemotaxis protein CheB [Methylomonas lenta]OAI10107.1 chemotaxis protein CheB [Methylomonas lenta]